MQRKGLSLERVYKAFEASALQPLFTIPVLAYILRQPDQFKSLLARNLGTVPAGTVQAVKNTLGVLAVLGLIIRSSKWLSKRAANNWTVDKTFDPAKEIVVVTGGSQGLGLAITQSFAARGVRVAVLDKHKPKVPLPDNATFFQADVVDWQAVNLAAERIRKDIGDPTVVVNNAGISAPDVLLLPSYAQESAEGAATRIQHFQQVLEVNLTAHLRTSLAFVPAMISQNHGHVVSIASMFAYVGASPSCEYCMSKVAVQAFHEVLAMELKIAHKAPKIRTTSYFPAWIRTPMAERTLSQGGIPSWQIQEPENVADEIVAQVFRGESGGQVVSPARLKLFTGLRGFPMWMQILFKELFFADFVRNLHRFQKQ